MKHELIIGCVADDFTGASDAASFLASKGMKTILYNGIPQGEVVSCDAVVIALKSRSQAVGDAVADCMEAFRWLEEKGASHLYFKYCSTFDSTREGNIGPVVDKMLEEFGELYTILSPALPVNGRSVKDGVLYVDGVPLAETHMKDHPLTPMWESDIGKLMEPQGKYKTMYLNYEMLEKSKTEILEDIALFATEKEHFYIVPDYLDTEHGTKVAELFVDLKLLTGGSGILAPLAEKYLANRAENLENTLETSTVGNALVLAGSCSKATLGQIADFQEKGYLSYRIDPLSLLNGEESLENIWNFIEGQQGKTVLVYSSDTAEKVAEIQRSGREKIAEMLESLTAEVAKKAVESGYTRIIVAGGETSSAVAKKLGYDSFQLGESVAAGVPVMAPISNSDVRVVLKSGNFGQEDFFERAVKMTGKEG